MKLFVLALCLVAFVAVTSAAPEEEESNELERLVDEVAEALLHEKEIGEEISEPATKGRRRRRRRRRRRIGK